MHLQAQHNYQNTKNDFFRNKLTKNDSPKALWQTINTLQRDPKQKQMR